jgi:hypothetical protein
MFHILLILYDIVQCFKATPAETDELRNDWYTYVVTICSARFYVWSTFWVNECFVSVQLL